MAALVVEVINENVSNVELLLERGANVNYTTKDGETPLLCAVILSSSNNGEKIIELLLQFGAEAQILFDNGENLIDYLLKYPMEYPRKKKYIIKPILAHLSMLTAINKSDVKEFTCKSIDAYPFSKSYFNMCLQQLEELKNIFLYGTITLFKLLHVNKKILVAYAHNSEFITAFESIMNNQSYMESYYLKTLQNRVTKAVQRMELEKKLAEIIKVLTGFCFHIHNIIVLKIISYLDSQDLNNLRQIENIRDQQF